MEQNQMTEDQLDAIAAIEKHSRAVKCPACGEHIRFSTRTSIIGVHIAENHADLRNDDDDHVHYVREAELRIIAQARESGILEPFIKACEQVTKWSKPADLERFFVTFMRSCQARPEPAWKLKLLFDENIGGHLIAYQHSQITMIVADDNIKMFVPLELFVGGIARKIQVGRNGTSIKQTDINDWIRTRFGYVAGTGAFYSALQAECTAIWGNASRKQRK